MISVIKGYPQNWEEALPIGNGTIGALLFAGSDTEKIILSHESTFMPIDDDISLPDLTKEMEEASELIRAGKMRDAQDTFFDKAMRKFSHLPTNGAERFYPDRHHPAMQMLINCKDTVEPERIKAEINLDTACAQVEWRDENRVFVREAFISMQDRVGIIRLQCNEEAVYDIRVLPADIITDNDLFLHERFIEREDSILKGNTIIYKCFYKRGGGYCVTIRLSGGVPVETDGSYRISGQDILIRFTILTTTDAYFNFDSISDDYNELLQRHIKAWKDEYDATMLSFGTESYHNLPNEELIQLDTQEKRWACYERMYAFGRYAMLSDSGALPPNAQGIWNGSWSSGVFTDYVLNIELEMAYWPVLASGSQRCLSALLNLIKQFTPQWRENATKFFNARGVLVACRSTTCGKLTHFSKPYPMEFWITGGAWIANILYEAYEYSLDMEYLKRVAFPFMIEAANFFMDVYKRGSDGKLELIPGMSPENYPLGTDTMASRNVTMDISLLRELFSNLIKAGKAMKVEAEKEWLDFLERLPKYKYNDDHSLREWADEAFKDNNAHRHLSHLYAAYPGHEASADPSLFEGCKQALINRINEGLPLFCGWSIGHAACVAAALGMGKTCTELLDHLIKNYVNPNLFTTLDPGCKHFQIDANHAFVAAINELMLHQQEDKLYILPGYENLCDVGFVTGINLKAGLHLEKLRWHKNTGEIHLCISAIEENQIDFVFPRTLNSFVIMNGVKTNANQHDSRRSVTIGENTTLDIKAELSTE